MQKGNIAVLAIIIVAVIAGYFFTTNYSNNQTKINPIAPIVQIPSPANAGTAQWKEYADTKYGYSIKYPNDWEAKDITDEEVVFLTGSDGPVNTTTLKNFLNDKSQEEYKSIVTLIAPDDIKPVVPKKGPGGFWISGIRIKIKLSNVNKEVEKYKNIFNSSGSEIKGQITTKNFNNTNITLISLENSVTGKALKSYVALIEKKWIAI